MEHQYPGAISGDEHMLAELMLPDQAHVRNQDWTIFFLHKDTSEDVDGDDSSDKANEPKRRRKKRDIADEGSIREGSVGNDQDGDHSDGSEDEEEEGEELEGGEGPPLIYVLNLVNTKQDTTAKRLAWQPHTFKTSTVELKRVPQGRNSESNGSMHKTFIFTYI